MTPLVVYLHGFRSSPQSAKARALVHAVAALPAASRVALVVPDLGHRPAAAIGSVLDIVAREHRHGAPLTFVGSSLGGFYATHLAERLGARAALINPAVRPWEDLEPWLGTQTNLYTGESFEVTDGHFDELRALAVSNLTQPDRYLLLVQTGDEVLDYRQAIAFYAGARQYVQGGGDHAFQDFGPQIPAILRFATDGEPG